MTTQKSSEDLPSTSKPEGSEAPKKRRGRPPKKAVAAKKKPGTVGRPKGTAAVMNEYKARMLASPKSEKVLEAIFNAALDDEHKHQAAAWKLVLDRVAPTAMFEQEVSKGAGTGRISINISTVGTPEVKEVSDIDGEYTEVDTRDEP